MAACRRPDPPGAQDAAARGRRWAVVFVLVAAAAAAAAAGHIRTRLRIIQCGYDISGANREHDRQVEINRRLRIELALLKSPERIARVASEQLGLGPPRPEQIRRLRVPPRLEALSRLERGAASARGSRP